MSIRNHFYINLNSSQMKFHQINEVKIYFKLTHNFEGAQLILCSIDSKFLVFIILAFQDLPFINLERFVTTF